MNTKIRQKPLALLITIDLRLIFLGSNSNIRSFQINFTDFYSLESENDLQGVFVDFFLERNIASMN